MSVRIRRSLSIFPLILSAAACGGQSDRAPRDTPASVDVQVARAAIQPVARTFEAGGAVRARTTAQLTSRIVAEVREIRVQPGDHVTRGQTVVLLDGRDRPRVLDVGTGTGAIAWFRNASRIPLASARSVLLRGTYGRTE